MPTEVVEPLTRVRTRLMCDCGGELRRTYKGYCGPLGHWWEHYCNKCRMPVWFFEKRYPILEWREQTGE